MKYISHLVSLLALAFFVGCTSQDTTLLRIGMSKAEVFKIMGQPDSTGADGQFEYLNYRVQSHSGYSYLGQPFTVRLQNGVVESYGTIGQLAPRTIVTRTTEQTISRSSAEAGIRILSVEPGTAKVGQPTEFKFKIAYACNERSMPGFIKVAFNIDGPRSFRTVAVKPLSSASGEVEISASATPKDWGKFVDFSVTAMLLSGTESNPGKIIVTTSREISLTQ